jgi:hypothetical protein
MLKWRRTLHRDTCVKDRLLKAGLTFLLVAELEVSTDESALLLKSGLLGDVATTDRVVSAWVCFVFLSKQHGWCLNLN